MFLMLNRNLTQARQILDEINKRIKIAVQVMPVYMVRERRGESK